MPGQKRLLKKLVHDLANKMSPVLGYFSLEATVHATEKKPLQIEKAQALIAVNDAIRLLTKIQAVLLLMDNGDHGD